MSKCNPCNGEGQIVIRTGFSGIPLKYEECSDCDGTGFKGEIQKNMDIETTEELAEKLADWLGIYGCCKTSKESDKEPACVFDKEKPFCCRNGFTTEIRDRMKQAVENDNKLEQIGLT